jgi:carbonic anhydrase
MPHPINAHQALERLRQGNARFVNNVRSIEALASQARRDALVDGQSPYAIILSCSDSRVPAELVLDCGLGDLFVVRVAGNVVAPSLVGSVEFAAAKFGTQLVVVMGHSCCGAIDATLDELLHNNGCPSENIRDIVERISPAVRDLVGSGLSRQELVRAAIRANVRASANHLRRASRLLEKQIGDGQLLVVGAEYALETGVVDFFDGLPAELSAKGSTALPLAS